MGFPAPAKAVSPAPAKTTPPAKAKTASPAKATTASPAKANTARPALAKRPAPKARLPKARGSVARAARPKVSQPVMPSEPDVDEECSPATHEAIRQYNEMYSPSSVADCEKQVETAGIPVASGVAHHGLHSIVALLSDVACAGTRA
ncbi:hypothetical protein AK812_SmicGene47508 [Symbiodinium microadriaticum]|uniref:Uncharacterized protein n=1 Tax=Symbiodinium microadriaticum TaxID=2951 RepID=A0A1Q9BRG7_SYMMI|nr:hypothetical protein AK812_SmicGene47508 [Symbiodinium microadriaticum]